jgi:hypothetical protein
MSGVLYAGILIDMRNCCSYTLIEARFKYTANTTIKDFDLVEKTRSLITFMEA